MVTLGDRAVEFVAGRFEPEPADAGRVQQLVTKLDDANYAVRRKAHDELMQLGRAALPALKGALSRPKLSAETRARIEVVVKGWTRPAPGSDRARRFEGAVQVLAEIGTAKAAGLLERLRSEGLSAPAWGRVVDGLQAGIVFDSGRRPYRIGQKVRFSVRIRNAGAAPVTLTYGVPDRNVACDLKVLDSQRRHAYYRASPLASRRLEKIVLPAGGVVTLYSSEFLIWPVGMHKPPPASTLVARPGKYHVSLTDGTTGHYTPQAVRWSSGLTTGEIVIEVLPAMPGDPVARELARNPAPPSKASEAEMLTVLSLLGEHMQQGLVAMPAGSGADRWVRWRKTWEKRCASLKPGEIGFLGHVASTHPDATSRAIAAEALGAVGRPQTAEVLVKCLGDASPRVRRKAARALGELRSKASVPELLRVLRSDKEASVRASACHGLGYIGSSAATRDLVAALKSDRDRSVRRAALLALGWIADPAALPPLREALKNASDKGIRSDITNVIRNIEDPNYWGLGLKQGLTRQEYLARHGPRAATKPAEPLVTVERTQGRCGYVGRVIDAETGKPVEKFVMRIGWTQKPVADAKDISWYATTYGGHPGGEFSISHSLPGNRKRFVYFLILGDGYLPQLVSDKPLSGRLTYKGVVVRLRRGRSITGRVLDHTGKPVAGADVFLVGRDRRLELVDGKPGRFSGSSGKTDKDGRFQLRGAGETTTHVVVSCKSLHAWATGIPKADGEMSIKLPAPATVVLKYDIPGAATNRFRLALVTWATPQWKDIFTEDTRDDVAHKPVVAQGNTVTLRNLTPGVYDVGRYVKTRVGDLRVTKLCDRRWLELKRGQTTRINFVRETGVAIVGDIPGLAANGCPGAFISIKETTVRPGPHSNMGPTILDFLACGPDGKFRTSRIPPGRYHVTVEGHLSRNPTGPLHTGERAPGYVGSAEVTVPAAGEPARLWIPMKPRWRPDPAKAPEAPATTAARERCWREMAGPGYTQASGAAAALGAGGDEAAKFLASKLLIPPADPAGIRHLAAQLGSPRHKVREKAQADLKALDMAALPGLRGAMKGDLSAEARTRVTALLAREPALLTRMERAIAILARLDRPRCLQVLRALAKRDPDAPETKLGKAKLQAIKSAQEPLGRASVTATDARIAGPIAQLGGRNYADREPADPEVTVEKTQGRCGYVGRVIDAETGKPVEKFAMRIGWTQKPVADVKDIPWYSTIHGGARPGGKFSVRHTVQKTQKQFVYFLILAEGYLPQLVSDKPLSGPFRHTGVVVRLKRGKSIVGRVLDHTGKPVVGGNVFLVSRQRRLELVDGKPEYFTGSSGKTDANGRFTLPGGGEATTHVVVSCKSLLAWLTKIPKAGEEFTIRLPAPATIVLKYDIPGAAAVGVFRVALKTWEMGEWKGLSSDIRLAPTVNQKGTVTLRNVTPGVYSVARRVEARVGDSGYGRLCDRQWIEVKSGQTRDINFVRQNGVPIVGDIPGLAPNAFPGASIVIEELTAPSGPGKKLEPALLDTVTCGPDGKFKTSRIPPGRHRVCAEAYAPVTPEKWSSTGWKAPAFVGSAEVTVPAAGEPARVRILMKPWQHPRIPAKAPEAPATAAARERCWQDMGTGDYAKASGGAAALGGGGDKAAKFLAEKLLIAPADPGLMKELIAQLDSPQYDPRQKAQADLKALGMAALPGLRAAAKGDLSAETRTRIKMLLAREPGMLTRMERAIVILARLDRPRCLQVLRKLAAGDPDAPETKLAKASLQVIKSAEELLGGISRTWKPGFDMSMMVSSTRPRGPTIDSREATGWAQVLAGRGGRYTLRRASMHAEVQAFLKLGPDAARACNRALAKASPGPDATTVAALLGFVGDRKSVPLLIDMLAKSGKIQSEPGWVTYTAATWALQRVTGRNLAMTSEGWRRWWRAVGEDFRLPRDRANVEVTEARVRPLVAALSRKDDELVRERLVALGVSVVPHLAKAMQGAPDDVRYRLAWVIDETGRTQDIPADIRRTYFIQRLGRERQSTLALAREARKRALTQQSFPDFCRTVLPVDCEPSKLAGEADFKKALNARDVDLDTAAGVLVAALADSDKAVRDRAAKLAATVGAFSDAAPAKLIDALEKRWRAEPGDGTTMYALSRFDTPGVRRVIVEGLHSDNEKVILACLRAAADTTLISAEKATEIAPRLTALTSHKNFEVRTGGVEVLARRAPALLRPHLERLCWDHPQIGRHCAAAMGQLKDPDHAQLLVRLADSPDSIARHNALKALGNPTFRHAIPSLVPLLWKSGHGYNDTCMWTIANAGGPQAVAVFLDELRKGRTCGGTIYDALEKVTGKRFKTPEQVQTWWWAGGMDMGAPAVEHVRVTDRQLDALWRQLESTSFLKRYQVIMSLRAGGDRAAAFLAGRLSRAPADAGGVATLIGQLGSDQWRVRQKAQADLKALDMAALPGLRAATKGDLPAEARTRIKALLAREPALLTRMERAIDVLAKLDRPRCLQVLRALAKRDPDAPETKRAKAALQAVKSAQELLGRISRTWKPGFDMALWVSSRRPMNSTIDSREYAGWVQGLAGRGGALHLEKGLDARGSSGVPRTWARRGPGVQPGPGRGAPVAPSREGRRRVRNASCMAGDPRNQAA